VSVSAVGGFDCHVHVVDPQRHPYPAEAPRVPDPREHASAEDLEETLAVAGLAGALVVQPSPYLDDSAALLDTLRRSGGRHRGIAGLSLTADDAALDVMGAAGVVGVRLNLVNFDLDDGLSAGLPALLGRLAERGWWVELQARAPEFPRVAPILEESGVRVLFDHLGYPDVPLGPEEPGFRMICAFASARAAAVKLSGAFRLSQRAFPHEDLDPFAAAVVASFGADRCVWGSDYPFLWAPRRPTYDETLAMLERWLPDPVALDVVLRAAPVALFGFSATMIGSP